LNPRIVPEQALVGEVVRPDEKRPSRKTWELFFQLNDKGMKVRLE
jgi:hypothetical protein